MQKVFMLSLLFFSMIGKATVDITDENTEITAVREHIQKYTDDSEFAEIAESFNLLISKDLTRDKVESVVEMIDDESDTPVFDIDLGAEETEEAVERIMLANEEMVEKLEEEKQNDDVIGIAESTEMMNEYFYKGSDKYTTEDMKELQEEYSDAPGGELTITIPL